ncbi:hypothetical protein M0811_01177 [Anaeramoeba ignava]|uniref:TLDc domain-containing protein n=1 Tax=Anaeramoeba ignava TaxID=1746090 RepID=A0A9Q0RBS2_ANAIG|nr:hypothetical protein M0811_01177 [Anaeramoeba ignava]
MKLRYSAKRDGFDCKDWHDICDNKGKTLVLIKTKDNFIFGGFTQVGWTTDPSKWTEEDAYYEMIFFNDPNAFIFSLRNDKNNRKPKKFPINKSEEDYAIYYLPTQGPTFGFGDICFKFTLRKGVSDFGDKYNLPKGIKYGTNEAKSYLAGSYDKWKVDEVETYFI